MASYDYDVIVIGSGAGGTTCARLLAKGGKSVAIIEADKLGGDCPNYACIPTKALLESAHLYHRARHGDEVGLRGSGVGFNYPSVRAWKNKAVKKTGVSETESSLHAAGINVIHGSAHFLDASTVTVGRARFSAKQFVIATGAEAAVPSLPGLSHEHVLTYKEALDLPRPPKSIAIIGGGAVGLEFASIFGSFGSKVYLVERSAHLLSKEDPLVGAALKENLEREYDVSVLEKASIKSVAKRGSKQQLVLKVAQGLHTIVVDELLFATGKAPTTDIGLENAGVKYDAHGISVNAGLQTSNKQIFAIGDVVGGYQFTHVSLYHGRLAAHNILQPKKTIPLNYAAVPRTVFTSPEIACVGLTPQEIRVSRVPLSSATADINVVSRAHTTPSVTGFVKVVVEKRTGVIVSASIVSPHASEMIHELTLAISSKLTAADIASTIHAFPTWSEAIRVACTKLAKR